MSLEAQRVYLTNKMVSSAGSFALPIGYPNQPFDIPINDPYGEFYIIGSKPMIMGGEGKGKARVRYVGYVQLNVWVPKERGTKIATEAGDVFKNAFQFKVGRDDEQSAYKFGVMEDATPYVKAGWDCFVYRVPFKRDTVEVVQISE